MAKAIGNAVIWGVLYFLVACLLHNFVFHSTHVFFGEADQILETAFVSAVGYFLGYRQGQKDPNSSALSQALIWGVIYFFLGCFLHNYVFHSTHVFFGEADQVLEACVISTFGYFFGCAAGKKS